MNYCKTCDGKMVGVMSFSKDKNEKFYQCRKCFSETKHRKIDNKELNFGEVLDKEIHRRK